MAASLPSSAQELKSRPRFSMRSLLFGIAIVALLAALWPKNIRLTEVEFARIQPGMQQSEVEQMIGRPSNRYRRRCIIWDPQKDGKPISHELKSAEIDLDFFPEFDHRGNQSVWLTKTGLIAVRHDLRGVVVDKYFSTVHPMGPPSLLSRFTVEAKPRSGP